MDQPGMAVSAFDCEILRRAFIRLVIEDNIPKAKWRTLAAEFFSDLCVVMDALPEPLAHFPVPGDERRPDIAPRASLCHQGKGWFARLALHTEQFEFVDTP
ncbi:hypothetical protein AB4Z43_28595 [Mesorhizobium sp. 2RAF45]|uniref:hypothetical protein n=1 Tax=Mesorhizobium sp. 2RAF45 TaxID=3233001 RepID=UPI003F9569E5